MYEVPIMYVDVHTSVYPTLLFPLECLMWWWWDGDIRYISSFTGENTNKWQGGLCSIQIPTFVFISFHFHTILTHYYATWETGKVWLGKLFWSFFFSILEPQYLFHKRFTRMRLVKIPTHVDNLLAKFFSFKGCRYLIT